MALATAYAKLKRYQRALEVVREAKRIAPSDNRSGNWSSSLKKQQHTSTVKLAREK